MPVAHWKEFYDDDGFDCQCCLRLLRKLLLRFEALRICLLYLMHLQTQDFITLVFHFSINVISIFFSVYLLQP